ncbi:DUF975 family protein [Cohnella zeiphila]|uniref:DUF975 family protein n=1 Tax=Cohnella zeiphila TaxID=2761120 RepID=A0A7X0VXT6_9BACL|nr:DUF975 family protein [Cohnella zeiphila]MBB6734301.1 DUF975 family protein [Cohnella zeiphila]
MPTYSELRFRARASLRGNWTGAVLTTLLLYVILFVIGLLNSIPLVGWLAELLLTGPLMLGMYAYYLELVRSNRSDTATLFTGFSQFVDAFLLYLLIAIFVFLWSLLLVIPGIIAALRYSQAYYILRDHPSIGALEAIRRSKEMMKGNKGRLFVLSLTFIGWLILGSIPFGIGLLWVYPYMITTFVHFYEEIGGRPPRLSPAPGWQPHV